MSQNEYGAGSPIHRDGDAARFGHDGSGDSTQTFGHDSDLSFVPFAGELSAAERDAIAALPSGSALMLARSGPTAGARYLLDTDVTTAGRHAEADIFLDDVTVSRRHAQITRHRASFEIVDQRSLNGTYVNGERITSEHLEDGDRVTVGRTSITFRGGRR